MKSITIHKLDDSLEVLLLERAKKEGQSLNRTIKKLLAEALTLPPRENAKREEDFLDMSGVWTAEDVQEFSERNKGFEKIDHSDWQ